MRSLDEARGMVTFVGNHDTVSEIRSARVSNIQIVQHRYYESRAGPVYQPSLACGDQEVRFLGFSWTRTRIPGDAMGVRLKSKWPLSWAHAESLGLIRDPRSKLRVSRAWGTRRSHKWRGKSLSTLQRPAMK
jgi:hypothetical protein